MGVPKFFRYISERYPCLSEFCLEDKIPQFDNLYLDMNGIIHNCSHPDDGNVHFRITEETIFRDIFRYIDKLFYLIQPQKLFFMAVDGVAPRAKMNQQRSRRFRSAKDAELLEEKAQRRGEKLPDEARFDSNCITPGTEFMVRLQTALQYFVKYKITTNSLWRKCRIILSGHETPGEGEHKIMEYIRYLKIQPDYDPNTRHCLYGLDADLIILGLCTHELHFSLLREEVKFGRKSKPTSLEETRFFLLHLGLLREYLELEFFSLTTKINDFDIEKLIDDWILMGFLVGNDFIPHLPNLHIATNALPSLYKAYMDVRPELGGYINECGHLNLERLEKYFDVLSVFEKQHFEEIMGDLKYFQAKRSGNNDEDDLPEAFDIDTDDIKNSTLDEDLAKLVKDSEFLLGDDSDDNMTEEQLQAEEFTAYKQNYYIEKLKYDKVTPEVIEEQTECYVRALQWILYYYYRGVPSWEWFYPHHYAPFVSDLKNFKHLNIEFELGKPFLPFEQLLAVLPAASKDLLPGAFRDLMTSSNSELIEYYPKDFKTDLNGKRQEWEAVVLIPFIDEKKLLKAMKSCSNKLTKTETDRNKHGPMLQYDYSKISQGSCDGPFTFKPLQTVLCTEKKIWRDDISVPDYYDENNIMPKKIALKGVYFPGFPTMKHIKYTGELRMARVKVFEQPSRNENMILIPEYRIDESDIYSVAEKYLDQEVYIGWPHLTQAKIIAVSTIDKRINTNMEEIRQDPRIYDLNKKTIIDHHMVRMGIDFQDLTVLVHALPSAGTEYVFSAYGKMTLKKSWSKFEVVYPAQGIVKDIATYNPQFMLHKRVEDIFPANSSVFMLAKPYIGSEGKVIDPKLVYTVGRIKVNLTVLSEPDFTKAKILQKDMEKQYMNSFEAATIIGIQPNCLARITGSIFAIDGMRRNDLPDNTPKINIGLQLKFPKNNEEISGYMRKNGNYWTYSKKAVILVQSYYNYFPRIFELISDYNTKDIYFESDLFPDQVGKNCLKDLTDWLKSLEHHKAERVPCGTKVLEKETVEIVLKAIDELKNAPVKCVTVQVKPHLIMKPGLKVPESAKTRKRPLDLFDRFVVVKNTYQIPVGYKGTIVAVYPFVNQNSVRYENVKDIVYFYDVLFDKTLPEGATLHGLGENRFFKICENSILEICTEDKQKIEQKPIINNLHLNENVLQSVPPLPVVSNLNSLKKFSNSAAKKSSGTYANQLLNAILKKNQINENNDKDNLSIENNDNNKIKTNEKETIKKPKEESSQFVKKQPPPPPLTKPLTWDESGERCKQQNLQELQELEQIQLSLPRWLRDITEPFEYISKNEFLKPPENQTKYFYNYELLEALHKNLEGTSNVNKFMNALSGMGGSKKDVDDPARSTNVLRQMLGINPTTTTSETSTKNAFSIKDDNNKTFGQNIPIKNLPQPPPNWRAETTSTNKNAAENRMNTKKSQQKSINPPAVVSSTTSNTTVTSGTGAVPLLKNRQPPQPQPLEIFFKNSPHAFNSRNYTGPVTPPAATTSSMMHMFHYQNYHHSHPHSMLDYNNMQKQQYHNNYRNHPPPMMTNQYNNSPPVTSTYQMKVSNIDITKGKGAFIPLQALKQAKKLQESHKMQNSQNHHHHHNYGNGNHPVNNNNGNGNGNSKQSMTKMMNKNDKIMIPECSSSSNSSRNVPAASSNKNPEFTTVKQQQSFTPKRYPTPKIAAKFDNDFISN